MTRSTVNQGIILLWSSAFLFLFFVLLIAFQDASRDRYVAMIREELASPPDSSLSGLQEFYRQRDFEPIWLRDGRPTALAGDLLRELGAAEEDGLSSADYSSDSLLGLIENLHEKNTLADTSTSLDLEFRLSEAFLSCTSHLLQGRVDPEQLHEGWTRLEKKRDDIAQMTRLLEDSLHAAIDRFRPVHPAYFDLRRTLAEYRDLAAHGGWPFVEEGPELKRGDVDERIPGLRRRLIMTGDLPAAHPDTSLVFGETLERAVRVFQRRHGLPADGVVGSETVEALNVPVERRVEQIELNMERWRWMPDAFGRRHILVQLPAFTLEAFEDGTSRLKMKVVIGKPATPTELFHSRLNQVVIAPYWYVPSSIATEEILPILRRDTTYLSRNHFSVLLNGRTIDAAEIDWNTVSTHNFPYTFRQEPGRTNSLGGLRFTMSNVFDIGMHDSPERRLFNEASRAFSHGCIRLEDPIALAQFVLNDSLWTRKKIREHIARQVEHYIKVNDSVPVYMLYHTAWVDANGLVQFREDIYGYDEMLAKALR